MRSNIYLTVISKTIQNTLQKYPATLLAVSLNIVLQKAPVSNDQGFFIFFNQFEIGGFLQYA
jgi:hypothetical protein